MLRSGVARRLGWREISASKPRSFLIAVLIALPVAAATVLSLTISSSLSTMDQRVAAEFGGFAGRLVPLAAANGSCLQTEAFNPMCPEDATQNPSFERSDLAALPEGLIGEGAKFVDVAAGTRTQAATVATAPLGDPRARPRWVASGAPAADSVLVTRKFAWLLSIEPGDSIAVDGATYRIAGYARTAPWVYVDGNRPGLVVGPGHPLAAAAVERAFLTSLPDSERVRDLTRLGWGVETPEAMRGLGSSSDTAQAAAIGAVIGVALLVSLLVVGSIVGAAFAMNLQRRRRMLALLQATGAESPVVRGVVVWQGVVLGLVGALAGAAVGIAAGWAIVSLAAEYDWFTVYSPSINWLHLSLFVVLAVVVTASVALLTSRSVAKQDALTALRTSHTASRATRPSWLAGCAAVAGLAVTVVAATMASAGASDQGGGWRQSVQSVYWAAGAGALLFVSGILGAGWLIQRLSCLPWPGLTLRMAMRDAGRNRGRTVSTAAAMSGAMVLGLLPLVALGAQDAQNRADYFPSSRPGLVTTMLIADEGRDDPTRHPDAGERLAEIVNQVMGETADVAVVDRLVTRGDSDFWHAQGTWGGRGAVAGLVVGTEELVRVLAQGRAAEAWAALEAGQALVFGEDFIEAGQLTISHAKMNDIGEHDQGEKLKVPALLVAESPGLPVILPLSMVNELGIDRAGDVREAYLSYSRPITQDERELMNARAGQSGYGVWLAADTGPDQSVARILLPVAAAGLAVALAVAVVAAGLAVRDGSEGRTLLANIGASRATLRRTTGVQAFVAAGYGSLLGAAAALIPAVTVAVASGTVAGLMPWWHIAAVVLLPVPLVALAAALMRPPAAQRVVRAE